MKLKINNNDINKVKEVCFLGVMLDENLPWKAHISHVAHKISKSIGIIYRSSFYLFKSALRILYFALVYPYFQYCITVWRSTYSTNLNRIVVLQKRALQIIDKQDFGVHTSPIFYELIILKFEDIYLFNLGKFIYQYKHTLLPDCFACPLLTVNQIHNYNTLIPVNQEHLTSLIAGQILAYLLQDKYSPIYCNTNTRLFSVNYRGPKFFNTLNPDICNSSFIFSFQSKLRSFLLSRYI